MSSDGPSKTKKEKKETNTINPKTVIAIKIYVRSMFFIISFYGDWMFSNSDLIFYSYLLLIFSNYYINMFGLRKKVLFCHDKNHA